MLLTRIINKNVLTRIEVSRYQFEDAKFADGVLQWDRERLQALLAGITSRGLAVHAEDVVFVATNCLRLAEPLDFGARLLNNWRSNPPKIMELQQSMPYKEMRLSSTTRCFSPLRKCA